MNTNKFKHIYGPVPSRRLGRSLGVDLVPFKVCTYDCIYCQLGRTTNKTMERKEYVSIDEIFAELRAKLSTEDTPDYISLAGSGEPTLNSGIGELICRIKDLTDIPVAILTNGSLLWMREVQDALMSSDLVIPSIDAGDERLFQNVNRPHRDISFEKMVDGIANFTKRFQKEVWLEILLLGGITGIPAEVKKIAAIAQRIKPARVQLNTVCRPPAEDFAFALSKEKMRALKDLFSCHVDIIGKNEQKDVPLTFQSAAKDTDILALVRRRPCTAQDVAQGLGIHVMEALKHLEHLLKEGKLGTTVIGNESFYTIFY